MTAETAVVLPVLVLVLALLLGALSVGAAQVRCIDASRVAARSLARGEDPAAVRRVAAEAAPPGARIDIVTSEGLVTVRVSADVGLGLGDAGRFPIITVSASATAAIEEGAR